MESREDFGNHSGRSLTCELVGGEPSTITSPPAPLESRFMEPGAQRELLVTHPLAHEQASFWSGFLLVQFPVTLP